MLTQLDSLFSTFYFQFIHIAKWLFIMKCASDIIKKTNDGCGLQDTVRCCFSYAIGYGLLYGLVDIMESVEAIFK